LIFTGYSVTRFRVWSLCQKISSPLNNIPSNIIFSSEMIFTQVLSLDIIFKTGFLLIKVFSENNVSV